MSCYVFWYFMASLNFLCRDRINRPTQCTSQKVSCIWNKEFRPALAALYNNRNQLNGYYFEVNMSIKYHLVNTKWCFVIMDVNSGNMFKSNIFKRLLFVMMMAWLMLLGYRFLHYTTYHVFHLLFYRHEFSFPYNDSFHNVHLVVYHVFIDMHSLKFVFVWTSDWGGKLFKQKVK